MKNVWKTKYAWYMVDDEGRMTHPGKRDSWRNDTLSDLYDNEDEAMLGLQHFYSGRYVDCDNHILQKVYVKWWGG